MQLRRLALRPLLGLARAGSYATQRLGRDRDRLHGRRATQGFRNERLSPLFAAAYEAAEESVYNCLVAASPARAGTAARRTRSPSTWCARRDPASIKGELDRAMEGMMVELRVRLSAADSHYGGNLVDGAHGLELFGDIVTELAIRTDGDEGLFAGYERVEFLAPLYGGDFVRATGTIVKMGNTSRTVDLEMWKEITARAGRERLGRRPARPGPCSSPARAGHLRRQAASTSAARAAAVNNRRAR